MELSGIDESEDRIAALEFKLTNMEALVKGLIAELPDFRAVARTMSRETDERNRQEFRRGPVVQGTSLPELATQPSTSVSAHTDGSTVIRTRTSHLPDLPAVPAEPVMVRIMQTDGTMKLEPRFGEEKHIDSTGGYGRNRKDLAGRNNQNPLIYAAEKEKPDSVKS
ncbi:MAG: hypothetical protein Q8R70_01655 [Methanoregula sp.]|nr:hypothetical protein [Methanoregula sp.]